MVWIVSLIAIVVIVALSIPILAIVLDSPFMQKVAESRRAPALESGDVDDVKKRLGILEREVDDLTQAVQQLRDENQFLQRLLDGADDDSAPKLPPAT